MRRLLVVAVPLVVLGLAPSAQARAPRAVLVGCDRAAGVATFEGRMEPIDGSDRMAMRFVLQSRAHGHRWHRLRVPGFSAWHVSEPGRSRYVYTKKVEGLVGPAGYRVTVSFRWLDATGAVMDAAHDVSAGCRQPDPRPDLLVEGVSVRPDRLHYAVTVRNAGHSAADPSQVRLGLGDGGAPLSAALGALEAGGEETVVLAGRACVPGSTLTATADADDAVDERDEGDNVLAATCA